MKKNNNKNAYIIILLLILIIILLYLLIRSFGSIDNHGPLVPTGNVDIFEIECTCVDCTKSVSDDDLSKNELNVKPKELEVFDNYKIWDSKELRIFSNPAYEYESVIAPGSMNSYTFVVRNNNSFALEIDISFDIENEKNVNMLYKLRSEGDYYVGTIDEYDSIEDKTINKIKLPAKSQKAFILDWKWVDSDNDTEIGFDIDSTYKLIINIGANQ